MALEFAIVGPVILIILFAIFEFGRYYMMASSLQFTVEEAGRYAMTEYTREFWANDTETEVNLLAVVDSSAENNGQDRSIGWLNTDFNLTGTPDTSTDPSTLLIEGTATFEFMVPFVPVPTLTIKRHSQVPMIRFDT